MSRRRLPSDVYKTHNLLLLVVALFLGDCDAKTSPNCVSSCGNIPNISHPFRVKGDPDNCGNKKYELECEHNRLVYTLFSSAKYFVHAINYNNYSIRLADVGLQPGNCSSLPLYSLSYDTFRNLIDDYKYQDDIYFARPDRRIDYPIPMDVAVALWVSCEKPVKEYAIYRDSKTSASSCIEKTATTSSSSSSREKGHYSYFLFGSITASDVADDCKIDEIVMVTLRLPADQSEANMSFSDFHSKLEYGFELSWSSILCEPCRGRGDCFIAPNNSAATCYKYCGSSTSLKKRSFLCRLELFFWAYEGGLTIIIVGSILGARTACGMLCLSAFLIYKFMRRHLSMFDTVEDFLQSQNNLMPIRYSYWQLKKMSRGFKDKLGEGGYGSVYKGKLRSGYEAAIKVLEKSKANGQEFINEVATIGRIHHVNVV